MDEHLGVAVGGESVTALAQLLAQAGVVVDLAVEGDPDRAVLVGERLVAALEVEDRQAPHADAGPVAWIGVGPLVVGTAVLQTRQHRPG